MNRDGIIGYLLILVLCLSVFLSIKAWADDPYSTSSSLFTDQELDNILTSIALYPDPLLAQMLPASTYPDEIADAYDWQNSGGAISEIDNQNWDESIKAIDHYPNILKMMAENEDWTADIGDAFLNQPEDVTRSIQRLRWQARDAGNLQSNAQQTVVIDGDNIEIIPAQPQYVYVPQYDPSLIYAQGGYTGGPPLITFGFGLMIGDWLNMDFDWGHHRVFYHGWNRPGWVNRARPYIHVTNVYVRRSRPYINTTWRHDVSHGSPDRYRASHPVARPRVGVPARMPEIRGTAVTPTQPSTNVFGPRANVVSFSNRGKESRGIVSSRPMTPSQDLKKQPTIPVPSISQRPASRTPSISQQPLLPAPSVSKGTPQIHPAGESFQPPKTPSVAFGGYRGANEARGQSLRGQASRQSSEGIHPSVAPAPKGSAPAGKGRY